jgi:tetratricopeptide (TPR) repeat protein
MADQNADRDLFNIGKVEGDVHLSNQSPPTRTEIEKDLLKEVRTRVEARLAGQLHHAVRLNLQKELQPKQVRPWSMEVKVAIKQPNQLLSPDTTIEQVFDRCSGRLLILGEPGAGKTTSLLDLTLELVTRAEADSEARVPVIVDLSDWQPTPPQTNSVWNKIPIRFPWVARKDSVVETLPIWSIADWLVVKVQETYGFPPKKIEKLLAKRRLIPLLDGLDEVRPEYQQDCVRAIEKWLRSDLRPREVAVCCRREQYEAYSEKLELDAGGAVYLQDLTDEQIQIFLNDVNRSELWASLAADDNLLELIRRPLLLSMAVLAYSEIDRTQWQQTTSAGDRVNLLLDAYVQRMLTQDIPSRAYRKGKIPSIEQSQKWLEILALQLLQDSETDFLIEKMQPRWLSTPLQKWLYILALGLFVGLFSVVGGIYLSTQMGIGFALCGLVLLWTELYLIDEHDLIKPMGLMKFSPLRVFKQELWRELWGSYSWTMILVSIAFILVNIKDGLISTLLIFVIFATCNLLFWALFFSSKVQLNHSNLPNQGIYNAIYNVPFAILIYFFPLVTYSYLSLSLHFKALLNFKVFLSITLSNYLIIASLIGFLLGGGLVILRHFVLRLILIYADSIPNNYARFLNYMTERLLIQRVGGRYRFIHDLLRQTLAQRRINKHPELISSKIFARCGESYYLSGQYNQALKNFDRAIEIDPKYSFAIISRGRAYRSIERYDDALQDFTTLIKLNGKNDLAFAGRGETYRLMERYEEALKDFNHAIAIDPKHFFSLVSRGETYQALEQYNDALQDFKLAIKLDPENTYAILYRAIICREIQKYDEALQDFNVLVKLNDKNEQFFAGRGEIYRLMERYEEALKDFNCAIAIDPKYSWAIVNRGETYQALGQYNDAFQDFSLAIKLDSENTYAILCRAIICREIQKYDEALQDFNVLVKLNDKNEQFFASRGETYRLMERYEEALEDFNCAIAIDPKHGFSLVSRGEIYQALEQYNCALQDFSLAIKLDSGCTHAILCRAKICREIQKYDEALQDFNVLVKLNDKNEQFFAGRGETYRLMEQYEEALEDFNCAIKINPMYDWAIMNRGVTYGFLEYYEKALNDFNRPVESDSKDDCTIRYYRSLIYFALQQTDLGKVDLDIAIQIAENERNINPGDCENTFNLALCYIVADEISTSKFFYQIALQSSPSMAIVRGAIRDLEDLIKLLGDVPLATEMIEELKQHLK